MLMTGKEYLESIRDGRTLYVGRERITDQTRHPAFAGAARTYAALYDLKSDLALRDLMTFEERGERCNMYYLQPPAKLLTRGGGRAQKESPSNCSGLSCPISIEYDRVVIITPGIYCARKWMSS